MLLVWNIKMPKPKQFLKSEKKRGTKAAHVIDCRQGHRAFLTVDQIPQTADEYLAGRIPHDAVGYVAECCSWRRIRRSR